MYSFDKTLGGLPSALVDRSKVENGDLKDFVFETFNLCNTSTKSSACTPQGLCQTITGNLGSPQAEGTSLSPGFRKAMIHFVSGTVEG
jgi:hypothetical protein